MNDNINPKHYTELAISPLEYIEANQGEFDWAIANVIKYVSRYKRKNGVEDLEKASWYLNHQIELEKKKLKVTHISQKHEAQDDGNILIGIPKKRLTRKQNKPRSKTGFYGVDFYKATGRYRAKLIAKGRNCHLGFFDSAIEAAKAYDEFVKINNLEKPINFKS
jgi:hypothetical protein